MPDDKKNNATLGSVTLADAKTKSRELDLVTNPSANKISRKLPSYEELIFAIESCHLKFSGFFSDYLARTQLDNARQFANVLPQQIKELFEQYQTDWSRYKANEKELRNTLKRFYEANEKYINELNTKKLDKNMSAFVVEYKDNIDSIRGYEHRCAHTFARHIVDNLFSLNEKVNLPLSELFRISNSRHFRDHLYHVNTLHGKLVEGLNGQKIILNQDDKTLQSVHAAVSEQLRKTFESEDAYLQSMREHVKLACQLQVDPEFKNDIDSMNRIPNKNKPTEPVVEPTAESTMAINTLGRQQTALEYYDIIPDKPRRSIHVDSTNTKCFVPSDAENYKDYRQLPRRRAISKSRKVVNHRTSTGGKVIERQDGCEVYADPTLKPGSEDYANKVAQDYREALMLQLSQGETIFSLRSNDMEALRIAFSFLQAHIAKFNHKPEDYTIYLIRGFGHHEEVLNEIDIFSNSNSEETFPDYLNDSIYFLHPKESSLYRPFIDAYVDNVKHNSPIEQKRQAALKQPMPTTPENSKPALSKYHFGGAENSHPNTLLTSKPCRPSKKTRSNQQPNKHQAAHDEKRADALAKAASSGSHNKPRAIPLAPKIF